MSEEDDVKRAIREAAKAGRVEYADSFGIEAYPEVFEFIDRVLGHTALFVSDQSSLSDFTSTVDEDVALRTRIFELCGITVDAGETLLSIMIHP